MIPEGYHDLLTSTALANVATIGSRGEHVTIVILPQHTSQMG